MKSFKTLIASLLTLACFTAAGQSIPVTTKLGKISMEEMKLDSFQADTSAIALVLWKSEDTKIDYNIATRSVLKSTEDIMRVKVLKDEGKDYADGTLILDRTLDRLMKISVTTYNLEGGKIVSTKLAKSEIMRSTYEGDYVKVSFAARNVKVGSVVEVMTYIESDRYFDIPDFYFQNDVPVNLCQYRIAIPNWLGARKTPRGHHYVDCVSDTEAGVDLSPTIANSLNVDTYRAVNVPAMRPEKSVYNVRQYRSAVAYDITQISLPGNYQNLSKTWGDIAKAVEDSDIIRNLNASYKFKDEISPIMKEDIGDKEKLAKIAESIRAKVQWNDMVNLIPDKASEILKAKSGGSADINALFGSACKAAGYEVAPVLVRMRSSGYILDFRPYLSVFDTFIVRVKNAAGEEFFVDASDPCAYPNNINDDYLVEKGFMVTGDTGEFEWKDLTHLCRNISSYVVAASMDNGTMQGNMSSTASGGPAYDLKQSYRNAANEEKFIEAMEKSMSIEIASFQMSKSGSGAAMRIDFEKECEITGDMILVNPFLITFNSDAAVREEKRELPMDFEYAETINYSFRLQIPDGYVVEQLPNSIVYKSELPASVLIRCAATDSMITVMYKFDRNSMMVLPSQYDEFRQFWTDAAGVNKQMIILKKAK